MKKNRWILLLLTIALSVVALCACTPHQHTFEEGYHYDDASHWHAATCGHDAESGKEAHSLHYGKDVNGDVWTCTVCNYTTRTHAHSFGEWTVKKAATHRETGTEVRSCTLCDAQEERDLAVIPHTYNLLQKDGTGHWKECSCGEKQAKEAHQYSFWTVVQKPTLDKTGKEERVCSICTYRETRSVAVLTVFSFAIQTMPDKTEYQAGEQFDATGLVLKAELSDGSTITVTDYVKDKTVLSAGDTYVECSWRGLKVRVSVTVLAESVTSVSHLGSIADDTKVSVLGYYVGVADEGLNADKELLLKDVSTDEIIAVRNVTGTFPNYSYRYGDCLKVTGTLLVDTTANTPNKRVISFESATVRSSGNAVTYHLATVVEVSSWEQMQELFRVGSLPYYTYVRFTHAFFNRYTSKNEDVISYRLHLNASAAAVAGIKTDGTRSVALRSNVMEKNVGDDWQSLFFDDTAANTYPGTEFNGSFVAVYTGANGSYFQLTVLSRDFVARTQTVTAQDAVKEVAYAFYRQGTQIQYDQLDSRRHLNPSPEDATATNGIVLDCSSYVNACFFEAFGVNVLPYALSTKAANTKNFASYAEEGNLSGAKDVVGYWENADYTTAQQKTDLLASVKALLQVGDVLNYRHGASSGSSGHVYIYVGNHTFLHCSGQSYAFDSEGPEYSYDKATNVEKTSGAVQLIDASEIFENTSSSRYLFRKTSSDSVYNFCVLRPLARGLKPNEKSVRRVLGSAAIEKSCSVPSKSAVHTGEELTYCISVKNTLGKAATFTVRDELPQGVQLVANSVDPSGSAEGSVVTWQVELAADETVTLQYRVTVQAASGLIMAPKATVNGVETNGLYHTVSKLSEERLNKVVAKAQSMAAEKKTFQNPIEFAKSVYAEIGITLFDYTTVSKALSDLIDTTNKTCNTTSEVSKMLVPNLYGGRDIKSGFLKDNNRVRLVTENDLAKGDLILAEYNGSSIVFLYLGDSKLVKVASATKTATADTISSDRYDNVLVTIVAYDRFAVLRPSMTQA